MKKKSEDYHQGYSDGQDQYQKYLEKEGNLFQQIEELIRTDISQIYDEQNGQDGMYSMCHDDYGKIDGLHSGDGTMERVFRNKIEGYEKYPIRIYVLNCRDGGICILGYKYEFRSEIKYTIFHLGEDDGFFFVHDDCGSGVNYMNKISFIDMVSRAISLLNNNK